VRVLSQARRLRACPFGAMGYSAASEKVTIDPRRCYGCGTCRAGCVKTAIVLHARSSVPLAASVW
jgi:heterodisulfide reductase subunit A-like polyferredoxin